jgi:carbonic anhydrase
MDLSMAASYKSGVNDAEDEMTTGLPLPAYLATRYADWLTTRFAAASGMYRQLADEGQHPRAMVISCCDSRVQATTFFGTDPGEFFIHRNIANLVPPYDPAGHHHGTPAAVEYAVCVLEVSHIIILGHSSCGGVNGCYQMCAGKSPELDSDTSFVGRWLDILRPAYQRVAGKGSADEQIAALEKEGIIMSMENLMGFPFVRDATEAGNLTIHGLWNDIGDGALLYFNGKTFAPVLAED